MNEIKNTCQICARVIKAKTGVIAHHGYTRPGGGWQTASCDGARYLPYEISCDRLPPTIEKIKSFIQLKTAELQEFITNPPKTLTFVNMDATGTWEERTKNIYKTVERPEGFNPEVKTPDAYRFQTYEYKYRDMKYQTEKSIKYAQSDLEFMEERLKNWVAPK